MEQFRFRISKLLRVKIDARTYKITKLFAIGHYPAFYFTNGDAQKKLFWNQLFAYPLTHQSRRALLVIQVRNNENRILSGHLDERTNPGLQIT